MSAHEPLRAGLAPSGGGSGLKWRRGARQKARGAPGLVNRPTKGVSEMKKIVVGVVAAVLVLGAAAHAIVNRAQARDDVMSGTITMSGAWALYPMAVRWAEEYQKSHPRVRIDIAAGGAGKGMADCLARVVDIGMISRKIYPAEVEKGAWWVSVTKDAVVPVVSEKNPFLERLLSTGVTREAFTDIWVTGGMTGWGELAGTASGQPIHVYTRSDACGAAMTWAEYLGKSQEDLLGVGVYGDPGLADAVKRDAHGIGFNNINYVYDAKTRGPVGGLRVLPIDLDGNGRVDEHEDFYGNRDAIVEAIAMGVYPSPPARDLHFASCGRSDRTVVTDFIEWVLTDGQAYVWEAGYIRLSPERLDAELGKLRGGPEL